MQRKEQNTWVSERINMKLMVILKGEKTKGDLKIR